MIRKLLGDRVVDLLQKVPGLQSSYTWLSHQLRWRVPFMSDRFSYLVWRLQFEDKSKLELEDVPLCLVVDSVPAQPIMRRRFVNRIVEIVSSDSVRVVLSSTAKAHFGPEVLSKRRLIDSVDSLDPNALIVPLDGSWIPSTLLVPVLQHAYKSRPNASLFFSDCDQAHPLFRRVKPLFKSKFSRITFNDVDLIGAPVALRANVWRSFYRNQNDLAASNLSAAASLNDNDIVHVDSVLQHYTSRCLPLARSENALELVRNTSGVDSVGATPFNGVVNACYALADEPSVCIVVPTRDQHEVLKACIDSVLAKTQYRNFQIVIVDNGSECESTLAYFETLVDEPRVIVKRYDVPFNYSDINNYGASQIESDVVVLLNNDTEVISPDWLRDMVALTQQPQVGCVGAKLLYFDDTIQHAGVAMGLGGYAGHSHRFVKNDHPGYFGLPHATHQVSVVTAACLAVRRSVFNEVNGLNEEYAVAYNDVDFCLRVQHAGYQNVYCATAALYHYESKSRGQDNTPEKLARFNRERTLLKQHWSDVIEADPHYSKHLTRNHEDFSIRLDYSSRSKA